VRDEVNVVGITGHQNLTSESIPAIRHAIRKNLAPRMPVVGMTSLAEGSDQIFAEVVLALGGRLVAVVPSKRYVDTFVTNEARESYLRMLAEAKEVIELPYEDPTEMAFLAAGREIVDRSGLLLAVWDGRAAGGLGGTADVVSYARERGLPTIIIWPVSAKRKARAAS
jgi:hypothetical protein